MPVIGRTLSAYYSGVQNERRKANLALRLSPDGLTA